MKRMGMVFSASASRDVCWWKVFQFIIQLSGWKQNGKKCKIHPCVLVLRTPPFQFPLKLNEKKSLHVFRWGAVEILTICILIMQMWPRRCLFEYLENNYLKILEVHLNIILRAFHKHMQISPLLVGKIRESRGRWHIMPKFMSSADAALFTAIFQRDAKKTYIEHKRKSLLSSNYGQQIAFRRK